MSLESNENENENVRDDDDIPETYKGTVITQDKLPSKLIRILTVCAYLMLVSSTAVMLSLYYIFFWDPKIQDHGYKNRSNN